MGEVKDDTGLQTPMMRQWSSLKAIAGDALLFFRLGDFYELFGKDAEIAGPILGIVVTSRNKKDENAPALCGIPLHQFDNYVGKLLDRGFSVALAEQMEEPSPGKALVKRDIIQWLTPGMRLLPQDERPHYIATLWEDTRSWILAAGDVNTGHCFVNEGKNLEDLQELLDRSPVQDLRFLSPRHDKLKILMHRQASALTSLEADQMILQMLNLADLADAPTTSKSGRIVLGSLLKIIADAHPQDRLKFFATKVGSDLVEMSAATRRNLNLFEPAEHNLFKSLDKTCTAFGRRELKRMLSEPTKDPEVLAERQSWIQFFKSQNFIRKKLRERLNGILDIHRLIRKQRGPHDLVRLSQSLVSAQECSQLLPLDNELFVRIRHTTGRLEDLTRTLTKTLMPSESHESGWIRPGTLQALDELKALQANSEAVLSQMESRLRDELSIQSLKIKYHQVLGYIFEVTSTHKDKVLPAMRRVQSLANAERFKTPELEALEEKLLSVTERIRDLERSEINRLYDIVIKRSSEILELVRDLSMLDAAQSLAEVSALQGWQTPKTSNSDRATLVVIQGRHPMIQGFVPLDLNLEQSQIRTLLLTGPNMAGKSTVLRLSAVMALLHQIGSDVPARSMQASLFDRIMCRMGAQDDLVGGQSTFFVEMREVAQMLNGATERSLLIFDEIGRGTSTYDGMSLAWSIAESVHASQAISLIATHYLELAELEASCPQLRSFHLGVEEIEGKLVFTRQLLAGPASRSYGIQVARLAQIPEAILNRAEQKLKDLEKGKPLSTPSRPRLPLFDWGQARP